MLRRARSVNGSHIDMVYLYNSFDPIHTLCRQATLLDCTRLGYYAGMKAVYAVLIGKNA